MGAGKRGAETGAGMLGMRVRPGLPEELPEQIALQAVAAVRAGGYPPGRRLPSVRRMAAAIGVHRDTVREAYARLDDEGWVRVEPGSGVYVHALLGAGGVGAGGPLRAVLARARSEGVTAAGAAELLERWARALRKPRVLVVGPDPATAEVWAAELSSELADRRVPVEAGTLASLDGAGADRSKRRARRRPASAPTLLAAAPPELGRVARRMPPAAELFALRPGPGPRLRRCLRRLPVGAVAAVVSASGRIREEVVRIAAAERGREVAVLAPERSSRGVAEALSVARFVLVDRTVPRAEIPLGAEHELVRFRHLDRSTGRAIAAWCGRAGEGGRRRQGGADEGAGRANPRPGREP